MVPLDPYLKQLRDQLGSMCLALPGVQVVVTEASGKVLIQQRTDDGRWEFPAGSCQPGASFASTAVQELREETGLRVAANDLVLFGTLSDPAVHILHYPQGDVVHAFAVLVTVSCDSPATLSENTDGESVNHRFVDLATAEGILTGPALSVLNLYRHWLSTGKSQLA